MGGLIGMLATPSRKKTDTGNVSGEATEETQSSKPDQTENKS
jgi:hypothetical protein